MRVKGRIGAIEGIVVKRKHTIILPRHLDIVVGRRREKRWGMLFTCLTTRAYHVEEAVPIPHRYRSTQRGTVSSRSLRFAGVQGPLITVGPDNPDLWGVLRLLTIV